MEIPLDHKTIALETRRIRLREIQHDDLATIFHWRNTEKFRFLVHHNTNMISFDEFPEEFAMDTECHKYQFLVEKKESKVPVGFVYVYTFSEQFRSCFINLFIDEPFEKKGFGIDAFVLFSLFLFQDAGLKKLFATVFDFNDHSLSCIRHIGMRQLVGNITEVPERGKLLCFAADESLVPNLKQINRILSIDKATLYNN